MLTLIRTFLHDLLFSAERARLLLRSAIHFCALVAIKLAAVPSEVLAAWTARQWALHTGIAAAGSVAMAIKAGDRNRTPAEVRAVVAEPPSATDAPAPAVKP